MTIKRARRAGFCMGVRRAMDIVLSMARRKEARIYTWGPLIHNPQIIEMLQEKGIESVSSFDRLRDGKVVVRAHGVPPEVRERLRETGLPLCDATCPDVAKVQGIVRRYARRGYSVVIVGDRGHAEVTGLLGYSEGKGVVVSTEAETDALPVMERVCVVAQTTQHPRDYARLSEKVRLRARECRIFDTVCDSTKRRQEEAVRLAHATDAMVVVGGKGSANTTRLVQLCLNTGKPAFHVEKEGDLEAAALADYERIGVTAGASTPSWLIMRVVDALEDILSRRRSAFHRALRFGLRFLFRSSLYASLGALSLTYALCRFQGLSPRPRYLLIAFFYIQAMHLMNHFTERISFEFKEPARARFYERYQGPLLGIGIFSTVAAVSLSVSLGLQEAILMVFLCFLGLMYNVRLVPEKLAHLFTFHRLRDIPASRDIFVGLAWAVVAVLVPLAGARFLPQPETWAGFFYVFCLVFIRCTLFDIRDIQGDMIVGRETLPILIGKERTKLILIVLNVLSAAGLILFGGAVRAALLCGTAYTFLYLFLYHRRVIYQGLLCEAVVDGTFLFVGLVALLSMFWPPGPFFV